MELVDYRIANKVKALQLVTVAWMSIEFTVALFFGIQAHSVSLVAFGADSAVELTSALVVLWRFSIGTQAEKRAAQICGALLYALGLYILVSVGLTLMHRIAEPQPTLIGILLLVCAAVFMPILGRAKKALARKTGSRSLRADAAQSSLCAYMSWIALAGLLLNWLFHRPWADAIAALMLLPIVLKEAAEASRGEVCECC